MRALVVVTIVVVLAATVGKWFPILLAYANS